MYIEIAEKDGGVVQCGNEPVDLPEKCKKVSANSKGSARANFHVPLNSQKSRKWGVQNQFCGCNLYYCRFLPLIPVADGRQICGK